MKALTIPQPYASLLAYGGAHIYTLPWETGYRGPLAIHAAEAFPQDARDAAIREPLRSALLRAGFRHWIDLPTGAVIAVTMLKACGPCEALHTERELICGPVWPGRFAWHLAAPSPLPRPIAAHDAVGLWEWAVPPELAELLGDEWGMRLEVGNSSNPTLAVQHSRLRH